MTSNTRGAEVRALHAIQTGLATRPAVLSVARGLSHFGEHSLGWIGVATAGAALDPRRRDEWIRAAVVPVVAHAISIVVKRVVRRARPHHESVAVHVATPAKLSFPSSHASSATAAAVLLGRLTGLPVVAAVVPVMALSRLVLGVHYPSDVLAGTALGLLSAHLGARAARR